jgi:hypothetical protein
MIRFGYMIFARDVAIVLLPQSELIYCCVLDTSRFIDAAAILTGPHGTGELQKINQKVQTLLTLQLTTHSSLFVQDPATVIQISKRQVCLGITRSCR